MAKYIIKGKNKGTIATYYKGDRLFGDYGLATVQSWTTYKKQAFKFDNYKSAKRFYDVEKDKNHFNKLKIIKIK